MDIDNASTRERIRPNGDQLPAQPFPPPNGHVNHLVQFYETDAQLLETVGAYLEAGFANGETALVLATSGHRDALSRRISRTRGDAAELARQGRLIVMDAEQTLDALLTDGWPDEAKFRETVGGTVARILRSGRRLRAFGEMVAVLWSRGLASAALRLEELWNELERTNRFSLFCAYPISALRGRGEDPAAFARVCRAHDRVIPPEGPDLAPKVPGSRAAPPADPGAPEAPASPGAAAAADLDSRRLAAIVESSFDGIISKDLNGTITSWNRAAERIFGYTAEEAVGRPVSMLIPARLLGDETRILSLIRGGERVQPFETERVHKDGRILNVSLTVSPVRDGSGRIAGASKIVRDITEQKRYQAALAEKDSELRQAQKMEAVGRLAGGIAHDFNNLLTAINGYSEMALALAREGDPMREFLLEVRKSGDRAASLTQQLLAYSRKQILAPVVFDLNATVSDMDRMLRRIISEDIEIRTVLAPDLRKVKADPGQVQQIILNLVLNARDAMPQGGRLTLETSNLRAGDYLSSLQLEPAQGPQVMLSVTDNGVGMEEAVKARIFEPFYTTKEVGKGTGLGLSSVYGILKQSGGGIGVESEPGRGSTFRILLPQAEAGMASEPSAPKPAAPLELPRGGTILLVEDEETVRRFVARSLSPLGYALVEAKDGAEALALGEKQACIDLLLTDVVMPGMNGGRLAERLRTVHPDLKVVFMSGYPDKVALPLGYPDHRVRFLQKPFGQAQLAGLVREFLQESGQAGLRGLTDPSSHGT